MAQPPRWLRVVTDLERSIGTPLTRALNSDRAAGAMLAAGRLARTGLGIGDAIGRRAVHLLSLPSRRDVQRVAIDVSRLDRAIQELAQSLEERDADQGADDRR